MRRLTKADCYTEVIVMAAQKHDNELLLAVVAEMAHRVAAIIGPDVLQLMKGARPATDARGNIDKKDWKTRKRILFTAGMILELLRQKEDAERYDGPPIKKKTCCA